MEALQEQQYEIEETLDKLRKDIENLEKKEPSQRNKAIAKIEKTFGNLKNLIEAFEYDRIEYAATSDLSNSGMFEGDLRGFEKKYDELENLYLIKKDPTYAEKLHLLQLQGKIDVGDSNKTILYGVKRFFRFENNITRRYDNPSR